MLELRDMTIEELHSLLSKLGWAKEKEVTKEPIRSPYSLKGMPRKLTTYKHPRTPEKIKVDVSENMILAIWRDNRKKARTAWSPLHTIEEMVRMLRIP